jgi:hypothetical protein
LPIDIRSDIAISAHLGAMQCTYTATLVELANYRHAAQDNYAPSENVVDGRSAPKKSVTVSNAQAAGLIAMIGATAGASD